MVYYPVKKRKVEGHAKVILSDFIGVNVVVKCSPTYLYHDYRW